MPLDGNGEGGATEVGVFCDEEIADEFGSDGCLAVGTSPVYCVPNSVGENVRAEQNPSEELISSVNPSFALQYSQ